MSIHLPPNKFGSRLLDRKGVKVKKLIIMLKKIHISIFLLLMITQVVAADTGTYIIKDEIVDLDIQTSGNVMITYQITMEVTGGNIPWVTVGLPNRNYEVKGYGGAATNCRSDNYGSWTGVKLNLDETYYDGDVFEFNFMALQKDFVYYYKENTSSIQFTPCWWDNAVTEHLMVSFHLPPEIKEVTTTAEGAEFSNSTVTWEWNNVGKGVKHKVGMLMPLSAFPGITADEKSDTSFFISTFIWIFIVMMFIAFVVILFMYGSGSSRSSYSSSSSRLHYDEPMLSTSGYTQRKRRVNMVCPNDSSSLKRKTFGDTTIDFCDTCGGIFFDSGEIESLIDDNVDEAEFNTNHVKEFAKGRIQTTKCPRCDGKRKPVTRSVDKNKHTIYVCEDCKGIWMNHGTYQVIKDKRKDQEVRQVKRLEKDSDDYYPHHYWFFYPYIMRPARYTPKTHTSPSRSSSSVTSSCACVSCACVASCACACACAGGVAAGCSPKNKYPQITFGDNNENV